MGNSPLLRLLQLANPAKPIGGYCYSAGLEGAVNTGLVQNKKDLQDWLNTLLGEVLVYNDCALMIRLMQSLCASNMSQLLHWNQYALAILGNQEAYDESRKMGQALLMLAKKLGIQLPAKPVDTPISYVVSYCLVGHAWGISTNDLILTYLWGWLENQLSGAMRLLPIGHYETQKIMLAADQTISASTQLAKKVRDDQMGKSLPFFELLCAQHQTQYTRLFQS